MTPEKFVRTSSRPSFVSTGYTFLIAPKFLLEKNTLMSFQWEVKCVKELPQLSIRVSAVTYYVVGKKSIDFSGHFKIPEGQIFPAQTAPLKKMCACLETGCNIIIENIENLPTGKFRLVIEIEFWGQKHLIYQYFSILKVIK